MSGPMFCVLVSQLWLINAGNNRTVSLLLGFLWMLAGILPMVWP